MNREIEISERTQRGKLPDLVSRDEFAREVVPLHRRRGKRPRRCTRRRRWDRRLLCAAVNKQRDGHSHDGPQQVGVQVTRGAVRCHDGLIARGQNWRKGRRDDSVRFASMLFHRRKRPTTSRTSEGYCARQASIYRPGVRKGRLGGGRERFVSARSTAQRGSRNRDVTTRGLRGRARDARAYVEPIRY